MLTIFRRKVAVLTLRGDWPRIVAPLTTCMATLFVKLWR